MNILIYLIPIISLIFRLGVRVGEYNIATRNDCQKQLDGTTKCTAGVQDLAIEELIPHPQFNATIISNDIGLIRVTPMDLNRGKI